LLHLPLIPRKKHILSCNIFSLQIRNWKEKRRSLQANTKW